MPVFRCKMCGGNLEANEGATVCTCEYCGTQQTVPTIREENLQALFNRANVLRIKSEFDKAADIYEKIIVADEKEAEAYWGLILCKYGIEYVEDPKTYKRIPTCHRASYDAVMADEDYKKAIEYADIAQRSIYESEAAAIDEIQRGIIALAQKEDPYDVFICYKETDENGRRTQDSVIANDIYHQLTQEGFKVFYAAISLEDKIGTEYEPYIFSALNTAKVMLVLGTKPEYYTAVWVKNEWSRFLQLIKKDRGKMLIPCYRDMDPYELPEEFSHLQAQDMSKIGFINDLVRGIRKILVPNNNGQPSQIIIEKEENSTSMSLAKRAFIFLEDGDWEKADEYCEKSLDANPENASAYVGKLLSELHVHTLQEIKEIEQPLNDLYNYKRAIQFADKNLLKELQNCNEEIINRKNEKVYTEAIKMLDNAFTERKALDALIKFEEIKQYKDSEQYIAKCKEIAQKIKRKNMMNGIRRKAERALSEEEIEGIYSSVEEYKNDPEFLEIISQAKAEYKLRCDRAQLFWNEYSRVRDELTPKEQEAKQKRDVYNKTKNTISNLDNKIEEYCELKKKEEETKGKVQNINHLIITCEKNISQLKEEYKSQGFFARAKKKELELKIEKEEAILAVHRKTLSEAHNTYEEIEKHLCPDEEYHELRSKSKTLKEELKELDMVAKEAESFVSTAKGDLRKLRLKVSNPIYLATLITTKDKDLYLNVLQDEHLILDLATYKYSNPELFRLIRENDSFDLLPTTTKAKIM